MFALRLNALLEIIESFEGGLILLLVIFNFALKAITGSGDEDCVSSQGNLGSGLTAALMVRCTCRELKEAVHGYGYLSLTHRYRLLECLPYHGYGIVLLYHLHCLNLFRLCLFGCCATCTERRNRQNEDSF